MCYKFKERVYRRLRETYTFGFWNCSIVLKAVDTIGKYSK